MATNFIPNENTLYSLCFEETEGWLKIYSSSNDNFNDEYIDNPNSYEFADEDLWQFFKVAENCYALANYKYGTLWNTVSNEDNSSISLGGLQDATAVISPFHTGTDDTGDWVQFAVSSPGVSGLVEAGIVGAPLVSVVVNSSFSFCLKEIKQNPGSSSQAELSTNLQIDQPAFVNGVAPQIYPAEVMLMNEVYVPYFMVNDPTLASMADRIQQTPYYILRQYGQYELAGEYRNGSNATVTFVETWEYGWSSTISASVAVDLGFELGGKLEENEIILKEMEELMVKTSLNIEGGYSGNKSESFSKQIRAEAAKDTTMAIYGITSKFKLYQGSGTSAIASPSVPMKTQLRFLSISETYASS